MTDRTMYDGISSDAVAIRRDVWHPGDLVGFYTSGTYAWSQAEKDLFPSQALVGITPDLADLGADVADCETGDLTPQEAAAWVGLKLAQGYGHPTVYRSLSGVPDLVAIMGEPGTRWDLWVADWDGTTEIPWRASAAKQFRNAGSYDISVVYDLGWPHRVAGINPPQSAPGISVTAYLGYANFGLGHVDGADNYELTVQRLPASVYPAHSYQSHSNHFEHVVLLPGDYRCMARARNQGGYGPWSNGKEFRVS